MSEPVSPLVFPCHVHQVRAEEFSSLETGIRFQASVSAVPPLWHDYCLASLFTAHRKMIPLLSPYELHIEPMDPRMKAALRKDVIYGGGRVERVRTAGDRESPLLDVTLVDAEHGGDGFRHSFYLPLVGKASDVISMVVEGAELVFRLAPVLEPVVIRDGPSPATHAREYLATLEAPSAGARNSFVAGSMVPKLWGFGVEVGDAVAIAQQFAAEWPQPLSAKEVESVVRSGYDKLCGQDPHKLPHPFGALKYEPPEEDGGEPSTGRGKPKYQVGDRVQGSEGSGRVQAVTHAQGGFRYRVKWDVGRESTAAEAALDHGKMPPTYP